LKGLIYAYPSYSCSRQSVVFPQLNPYLEVYEMTIFDAKLFPFGVGFIAKAVAAVEIF
jgi:hypothetical protein